MSRPHRRLLWTVSLTAILSLATWNVLTARHVNVWLWDYLVDSPTFEKNGTVTDIMFLVVDHFEPAGDTNFLHTWQENVQNVAEAYHDADGRPLQWTWAYNLEAFRGYEADSLVAMAAKGYGEVEVQVHHKYDNSVNFRRNLHRWLDSLAIRKALPVVDGLPRFAFVHGNWCLDNSKGRDLVPRCGVNDELQILLQAGCFADFTFPAYTTQSQPSLVNKIYYAKDDTLQPKSYDSGILSRVGSEASPDELMIFEGPYKIDWFEWRSGWHPAIDDGSLAPGLPTSVKRFRNWVEADIHVAGQPDWIFIKTHCHGQSITNGSFDDIVGSHMRAMLDSVMTEFNDGRRYRLHFVTAREAYNIVRAAEKGMNGNPNAYRNFEIGPPVANATHLAVR